MKIAVIIPVLNEIGSIGPCLRALFARPGADEVFAVVADGGSDDGTVDLVQQMGRLATRIKFIRSQRGRGVQMNAGAAFAVAHIFPDVFLFLHADCRLTGDALLAIEKAMANQDTVGGAFVTHTVPAEALDDNSASSNCWTRLLRLADIRSRYTGLPYGDQGLFVRAECFARVGGFAPLPLMEDLDLAKRLKQLGRLVTLRIPIRVSGRRFQHRPVFYTAVVNLFPLLYRVGVKPTFLARLYKAVR